MVIAVVGWAGAALLLGAYALVSAGRLAGGGLTFQLMNLGGAAGLAINSAVNGAWPSVALNLVWIAVGAVTLAAPAAGPRPAGAQCRVRVPATRYPDGLGVPARADLSSSGGVGQRPPT